MKRFYIIWDEYKYKGEYKYCSWIEAKNRNEARDIYFAEQQRRRFYGEPHMFHVKIGLSMDLGGRKFKTIEDRRSTALKAQHPQFQNRRKTQ